MKRRLDVALSLGLLAVGAFFIVSYGSNSLFLDVDFNMRYNEVRAVLSGRDPFLIWKGLLPSDGFVPYSFGRLPAWHSLQLIHAYSPWAYVLMMPFALMERTTAAAVYRLLEFILLSGLMTGAAVFLRRRLGAWWPACLCFALMCAAASDGFTRCLVVGNFGIAITTAAFVALSLQACGHDRLAGVFWAIVLVKPQLGGLFALTLLLERKWRSLLTMASVLGAATLVSAALCGRSPVEMVLSVGASGLGQFPGTGLLSAANYQRLAAVWGERAVLASNALVGIAACCACWAIVRKNPCVWIRFVPAMVLSLTWATFRLHDFSIQLLPVFAVLLAAGRQRGRASVISAAFMAVALVLRRYAFYEGPFIVHANILTLLATYVFVRAQSER